MTSRQVIVGFCATCALLFSLAAAGTAGAQTAATAYECSPTAMTLEFNDADCTTKGGLGSYGHKEIPRVTKTNLRLSAEATFVLKTTDGGVILTLTAGEVDAEVAAGGEPAWIENVQNMTGRMEALGEGRLKLTKVFANHECKINGVQTATITTDPWKFYTESPTEMKFEPVTPTELFSFTLTNCNVAALNKTWTVDGTVIGKLNGSLVEFEHANVTTQGTLKTMGTIAAGFNGKLTLRTEFGNAIAFT